MKKFLKVIGKTFKWSLIVLPSIIVLMLVVRSIGRAINSSTPEGGINEARYVDINGQQMWMNIYSENKDNPILLYLHGAPGDPTRRLNHLTLHIGSGRSTSYMNYKILRKLADDYTVVEWDYRNSGKTWINDPQYDQLTMEVMREDIDAVTDYLLDYLGKDKLTVMGFSWGAFYALDFAQNHSEKLECCIVLSPYLVNYVGYDFYDDRSEHFLAYNIIDYLKTSGKLSEEDHERAQKIDEWEVTAAGSEIGNESEMILYELSDKYRADIQNDVTGNFFKDSDENLVAATFFSPYYSLMDLYKVLCCYEEAGNGAVTYYNLLNNDIYLPTKKDYEMPVYMLLADEDKSSNPEAAERYFESICAPDKDMMYIHGKHMATLLQSEELAAFVHGIAEKQQSLRQDCL